MDEDVGDVLVVDDNPGDRRFITEALENSHLELTVHTVDTSDEALEFLSPRGTGGHGPEVDVVLLDWTLSRETGEDVVSAATSVDSALAVVVMTGTKSEIRAVESSVPEADLFVEKPTDPDGYVEILRTLRFDR